MPPSRQKVVTPEQRLRDLRKAFKRIQQGEGTPGPERAAELAAFVKAAHDERQLNMAMYAAQRCLDEDPDPPSLLIAAYEPTDPEDLEERLRALTDLADLARYVQADRLRAYTAEVIPEVAERWVREGDEPARRHRLRTLTSMFDRAFADDIRDRLRAG